MGWCSECGTHEGFVVGLEERGTQRSAYREFTYPDDAERENVPVRIVQVGCSCGWRSPRMLAPQGTKWFPFVVEIAQDAEERARAMWRQHMTDMHEGTQPCALVGELV